MRFLAEALTGQIILIKPVQRQLPPTKALLARSAKPVDNLFIRLVLFLIALFRPAVATAKGVSNHWPPRLSPIAHQRIATLSFLWPIILMVIAERPIEVYLEKVMGVMA